MLVIRLTQAVIFAAAALAQSEGAAVEAAVKLLDHVFEDSILAKGVRADPESPSYGLVGWSLDHPENYWGDDNARAMLAEIRVAQVARCCDRYPLTLHS